MRFWDLARAAKAEKVVFWADIAGYFLFLGVGRGARGGLWTRGPSAKHQTATVVLPIRGNDLVRYYALWLEGRVMSVGSLFGRSALSGGTGYRTSKPRHDSLISARDLSIAMMPLPIFRTPTVTKQHVRIALPVLGVQAPTDMTIRNAPIVMVTGGSRRIFPPAAAACPRAQLVGASTA